MVSMPDKAKGVGCMSGGAGELPESKVIHRRHMTITRPSTCAALGKAEG